MRGAAQLEAVPAEYSLDAVMTILPQQAPSDPWSIGRRKGAESMKRGAARRHQYWIATAREVMREYPNLSNEEVALDVQARCKARGSMLSFGSRKRERRHGAFRTIFDCLQRAGVFDRE